MDILWTPSTDHWLSNLSPKSGKQAGLSLRLGGRGERGVEEQVGPFHNDNKETCQQVNSVELQKRLISMSDQCGLVLLLRATIEIMQNN